MDQLSEKFGKGLGKLRRSRNLTQAQLAEIIDCSVSLIGQFERGKKKPSLNAYIRLADALDVGLDEFRVICEINKQEDIYEEILKRNAFYREAFEKSEMSKDISKDKKFDL